jgi:papain like cysteine protease AvrRpt2
VGVAREIAQHFLRSPEGAIPTFLQPLQSLILPPAAASATATGGALPASGSLAGFSMQTQEETQWCWAAVSTSVAIYFGSTPWIQCQVASGELSPLDCCGVDRSTGCNIPWYLDTPLTRVGHFDRMDPASAPFLDIQTEINGKRPLCCRIAWAGGNAHFVALGGWSTAADGTEYVDIHDPYYGFAQKTYTDFVTAYRTSGDTWTHSYFTRSTAVALAGKPSPGAISPKSA